MLPDSKDARFQELGGNTFTFACNPDVPCFNQCCRRLNLVLTPYDILRLKKALKLSSDEFLDKYADVEPGQNGWPQVKLKMNDDKEGLCPFVTKKGCSVYNDRPGACRTYPLGRATKAQSGKFNQESYFLVEEDHCQGFKQGLEWSPVSWTKDQGLEPYNTMNDLFLPLITRQAIDRDPDIIAKKMRMFFLACYRLEAFSGFVNQGRLFELFEVDEKLIEKIKQDEFELLKFAFDWLKFSIFGEKTMQLRHKTTTKSV